MIDLQDVLNRHALWLRTQGRAGARADLTRADLTDANLTRADLTDANLTRANLFGADLTRANLTCANLTRANLTRADLTRANLTDANLTDANLTDAYLTDAYLTRANLTDADLTRANLRWAVGDGRVVRTMQTLRYRVNVIDDTITIGCWAHRAHEWAGFDDATIDRMDEGALDWWREWRDVVFKFADWEEYCHD